MLTVKQFRTISLVIMILAVVMAIASLSMARFAKISITESNASLSGSINIGAFHMCFDVLGGLVEFCGNIDKDCLVELNLLGQKQTFPVDSADLRPNFYKDGCDKFNIFRGMHVTATLFLCIASLIGGIYLCVNPLTSPKWSLGMDITYSALSGIAFVLYIISLISANQSIGDLPDTPSDGSISVDKWHSFWLTAAAIAFSMLALILWVVARFVSKPATVTGLEGMPLVDGNGSYVPPAAPGQQQYFNYGAPAPQPNYQQYGGQQQQYGGAPTAGYGYGYQPPPPQQ